MQSLRKNLIGLVMSSVDKRTATEPRRISYSVCKNVHATVALQLPMISEHNELIRALDDRSVIDAWR